MMKSELYLKGSNLKFTEIYNQKTDSNINARISKRLMNKWKFELIELGVFFESFRDRNVRGIEIKISKRDDSDDYDNKNIAL